MHFCHLLNLLIKQKWDDNTIIWNFFLDLFLKALQDNGTGYLVGNSITMADLGLLEPLLNMEDYLGLEHLEGYSALQVIVSPNPAQLLIDSPQKTCIILSLLNLQEKLQSFKIR